MNGGMMSGIIGTVIERREPVQPSGAPTWSASERNVRPDLSVYPSGLQDPVHYGDVPSRPARWPIVTFQAVQPILSVMRDEFGHPLWAPDHIADPSEGRGYGDHLAPWTERANIERGNFEAYGSTFQLSFDDQKELLMGVA